MASKDDRRRPTLEIERRRRRSRPRSRSRPPKHGGADGENNRSLDKKGKGVLEATGQGGRDHRRRHRRALLIDDREEDQPVPPAQGKPSGVDDETGDDGEEEEEGAKPVGNPRKKCELEEEEEDEERVHYYSFESSGTQYNLGDTVLVSPETEDQKPYAAVIRDIFKDGDQDMIIIGQWFYRPEDTSKADGGSWPRRLDNRELFYSFHYDEVPADAVMHTCVVHFVPLHKQVPNRKEHPGFIAQYVYDHTAKKLWGVRDKDYKDYMQKEINELVKETQRRLQLHNIDKENASSYQDDMLINKHTLTRNSMTPLVAPGENQSTQSDYLKKAEEPGKVGNDDNGCYGILTKFKAWTGTRYRDQRLEKLLIAVEELCGATSVPEEDAKKSNYKLTEADSAGKFPWPDAIPVLTALERVTHEAAAGYQKYNQKMRQLCYNLKRYSSLAGRLLNKEIQPSVMRTMTPAELRDACMAEERKTDEPERPDQERSGKLQMTTVRCPRCTEKKVGITDIIQAGGAGDRYQLECIACGNTWYSTRDDIASFAEDDSPAKDAGD